MQMSNHFPNLPSFLIQPAGGHLIGAGRAAESLRFLRPRHLPIEQVADVLQLCAQLTQSLVVDGGSGFAAGAQMLTGPFDRKPPVVEQVLYFQNQADVALGVQALTGGGALGADFFKFGFPKSQHVGGDGGDFAHFSDAKIKFIRNFCLFWCFGLHASESRLHHLWMDASWLLAPVGVKTASGGLAEAAALQRFRPAGPRRIV